MSRKPYMAESYQGMMKNISNKNTGAPHSEGKKPYMSGNYNQMEEMYFGQLSPWNFDMGNINFSSGFDFGDMGDMGAGVEKTGDDCNSVWIDCVREVCQGNDSCSGPGVVNATRNCVDAKGRPECKKPHTDILSCLYYNSLCYCLLCIHSSLNYQDCKQQYNEECQQTACGGGKICPDFASMTVLGITMAPATLCVSGGGCIKDTSHGEIDKTTNCVNVPDEGCGTKNVCISDICGNTTCQQVRMTHGVWVLVSTEEYPLPNTCFSSRYYECSEGVYYIRYVNCLATIGCNYNNPCGITGAISCGTKATYEWRCP